MKKKEKGVRYCICFAIILLIMSMFFIIYAVNKQHETSQMLATFKIEIQKVQDEMTVQKEAKNIEQGMLDFIQKEYENYMTFANQDRTSFFNLVTLSFTALGILITVGLVVLYWVFGQSRTEVENMMKDKLELEAKNKIQSFLDPKMEQLEKEYGHLQRFLSNQYRIHESHVLLLCPTKSYKETKNELKRIQYMIKKFETQLIDDFLQFQERVQNRTVDIIIYKYELEKGKEQEEKIGEYINYLIDKNIRIPVVIYAKSPIQISKADNETINKYPYFLFANMPVTVISNMINLINVISYEETTLFINK